MHTIDSSRMIMDSLFEWTVKILIIILIITLLCILFYIVSVAMERLFGWGCPSNEEAKVAIEKYVEIQLSEEYTLDVMEYTSLKHNAEFILSYIGTDESTDQKEEVIEKKISYYEIEKVISEDATKTRLMQEAEKNK
ncbi:hypothetical protein [Listeria seeligeri]|uniref:hypothetical protein n=1 Tax=Listeria seeligeri TaxID=1640 RepID=UPI00188767A5|nr:hypothetical protein [Listeria seeligeri]MBF2356048.1 hypothetical protein [Listeria seeligeri]